MKGSITDPEFINFCKRATSLEVAEKVTGGNIRGLDKMALRNLSPRGKLPAEVENILVAYFFNEFANKVYDRNSLIRIYDYWVTKQVNTVADAEKMITEDINSVFEELNMKKSI